MKGVVSLLAVTAVGMGTCNGAQFPTVKRTASYGASSNANNIVSSRLSFLHVTDFHYDPYYLPNTDASTCCHRKKLFSKTTNTGRYGNRGSECDSPLALIEETFEHLKYECGLWSGPNGNGNGDGSKGKRRSSADGNNNNKLEKRGRNTPAVRNTVSFVLWTGDNARHDRDKAEYPRNGPEVYIQNAVIAAYFEQSFNLSVTKIIPSIGNWDVVLPNHLRAGPNDVLDKYYSIYEPFFRTGDAYEDNEIAATFKKGGYYLRTIMPGSLYVISLNTLYFFKENKFLCSPGSAGCDCSDALKTEHPGDLQFKWLYATLERIASQPNAKVILSGHVPPVGSTDEQYWMTNCANHYIQLLTKFSNIIIASYYGHVNKDMVSFVASSNKPFPNELSFNTKTLSTKDNNNNNNNNTVYYGLFPVTPKTLDAINADDITILSVIQTTPSIVPVNNPGYRIGTLSMSGSSKSPIKYVDSFLEYTQYWTNINKANRDHENDDNEEIHYKLNYFEEYNSRTEYEFHNGLSDMNEWKKWYRKLQTNPKFRHRYESLMAVPGRSTSNNGGDDGKQLTLSPGLVAGVLIACSVIFVGAMGVLWVMLQRSKVQDPLEQQRLLAENLGTEAGGGDGDGDGVGSSIGGSRNASRLGRSKPSSGRPILRGV